MLWGAFAEGLELRRAEDGGARLRGRFPYGSPAVLGRGPGGAELREVFAPRAFEGAAGPVHLLSQHDFARPLASRAAGTLDLRDGDDALEFEARIGPAVAETSHARDALALIASGLAAGVSPGFTVREGGEAVTRSAGGYLRTITRAELAEISIVTRPAYPTAQVEARSWSPERRTPPPLHPLIRWRA